MQPMYSKEMPGAEVTFRPDHLNEYDQQPWDIRISIGNAPLDEAYFFSVESFADSARSIRELVEEFALNPLRESELDTDEYPELPFLQQELIQCYESAKTEQLSLSVFVNHCTEAIDLNTSAKNFLSACTFRDKSWDYIVLDLIFELETPAIDEDARTRFCERYSALENTEALQTEARVLAEKYERFGSVSVVPCALGVPDGFDVRLQMMEFDGLNQERCALLYLLWEEWVPLPDAFSRICESLAYKTNFSSELLEELKSCGDVFENT